MIAKRLLAEFAGTFFIVVVPVAAAAYQASLLTTAIASGLIVSAMIAVFASVSKAHFNPAVTLAFAWSGRISWSLVAPYWLSQFLGGIGAAGMVRWLFGGPYGANIPTSHDWPLNVAVEFLISFLLMAMIYVAGKLAQRSRTLSRLVVGLTVMVGVLIGGPVTGGSMNPARSLGPALFELKALPHVWNYLLTPSLGALAAAMLVVGLRARREGASAN